MDTTMDMPPSKMPTEGWVLIILTALGAKPLWDYLTKRRAIDAAQERERAEHSAEIELRKIDADEDKDHKLIRLLERQVRDEVKDLRGRIDANAEDKVTIATQAARIATLEADNERLRASAEDYRKAAEAAQQALYEAGRPAAAQQIGEEISEADDARSTPTRPR